jgi:hypothetical protein
MRSLIAHTDNEGCHYLKLRLVGEPDPPQPVVITCTTEPIKNGRKTLKSNTQFIVHPCDFYAGNLLCSKPYLLNRNLL